MPEISVGAAVSAGFEIIRRRPLAVWAWGLVNVALVVVAFMIMGAAFAPMLTGRFDPDVFERDPAQMIGMMAQLQGGQLILGLGRLVVQAVVMAAVFRAVLRPEQSRWAYMRLGMTELYLIVLTFGLGIALGLGLMIVIIPIVLVLVGLGFAKAVAAAVIIGVISLLLILGAVLYLVLRFSLAGPMIVADNQFRLFESWHMTKGRVWALFQTGLIMVLIILGLEMLLFAVFGAIGLGVLAAMIGGLGNIEAFFRQSPAAIFGALAPIGLLLGFLGSFVIGAFYAIAGAPWAEIYRQLAPPDPAKTFA